MTQKFNTLYNHTRLDGFKFTQPSLTEQSFGFETDINNIVSRAVSSSLPSNTQSPLFGGKFSPDSYNEALNLVAEAKSQFESLPSNIRAEFDNDPSKLLAFVQDDSNYDKAVKLGLIDKAKVNDIPVIPNPSEVTTEASKPVVTEVSSQ